MAQNKGILSLLDDDDDEEDEIEINGVGDKQPTAPSETRSQWQGSASYPKGTLPRLPPLQVQTQPSQTQSTPSSASRTSSGPQINMRLLLDFCKLKFPPNEYKSIVTDFAGLKASNPDSKEMLAKIRARIGPEIIQQFTSQVKSAAANGQSNPLSQPQNLQQVRQLLQSQQLSTQAGSSIMQSLKYNAEQNRQQKPGTFPAESSIFSQMTQPPDAQRSFPLPQQLASVGGLQLPLPSVSFSQQKIQPPVSTVPSVPDRPTVIPSFQPRPQLPSVLGKQQEAPSQNQPAAKRPKKDKEDIDEENDILKDSGINLEEEQNALLGHKGGTDAPALPKLQSAIAEETFLNLSPLQIKIMDIAKRHGLESVDRQVGQLLSKALETHLSGLIRQVFAMTRQRTDTDRTRPGMMLTGNLRKKLHEINAREREKQKAQEAKEAETQQVATSKRKAAEEAKKADKAQVRDSDKLQASAANAAAAAAFGSKAQKWGAWSTSAAKNPTGASQNTGGGGGQKQDGAAATPEVDSNAREGPGNKRPDGDNLRSHSRQTAEGPTQQKTGFLPPSRVKAEMLSAKLPDLVAVMEGHHMYQKSTLLYKLYDRLTD